MEAHNSTIRVTSKMSQQGDQSSRNHPIKIKRRRETAVNEENQSHHLAINIQIA